MKSVIRLVEWVYDLRWVDRRGWWFRKIREPLRFGYFSEHYIDVLDRSGFYDDPDWPENLQSKETDDG